MISRHETLMANLTDKDESANIILSNRSGADKKIDGECGYCNKYGHKRHDYRKLISDGHSGK